MSLAPININVIEVGETIDQQEVLPSKTYYLDFENGVISSEMVEGEIALRQFILKAVQTARFRYIAYTGGYGSELEELIGQDVSINLLQEEIPRVIKEALVYDDRIENVVDFLIAKNNGDIIISFKVITVNGLEIIEEVSV
jgi:hypothetical protein